MNGSLSASADISWRMVEAVGRERGARGECGRCRGRAGLLATRGGRPRAGAGAGGNTGRCREWAAAAWR